MTWTILHIFNQRVVFSKECKNFFGNLKVRYLLPAPNIIDFSGYTMVQNVINGAAMIKHMEPVPYIQARSIYGYFFPFQ